MIQSGRRRANGKVECSSLLLGILGGLLLAASFWCGHEFWPRKPIPLQPQQDSFRNAIVQPRGAALPFGENAVADIAAEARKGVVSIQTKGTVSVPDAPFHFNLPFKEFEFFFGPDSHPFGGRQFQRKFESQGTGSGVVFRKDGYILTNNHVIQADDISVTFDDKRVFKGKVIGRDSYTDLALVKIDATNLPVAKFGSSKSIRPGDWAIAIGSPLGLDHTVTFGIISALGRSLSDLGTNVELIQTDAAINPGNSGGPLLNIYGEVIGLNTAIRGDAQNVGFAIPIDVAKDVATKLLQHGNIARAYLGVYMQDLDKTLCKSLGLAETTKGVLIARVSPGSPADKAGVQQGDVIKKIDGKPMETSKQVQDLVRSHKPNDTISLLLWRNGALTAISIKVGDYPIEHKEK